MNEKKELVGSKTETSWHYEEFGRHGRWVRTFFCKPSIGLEDFPVSEFKPAKKSATKETIFDDIPVEFPELEGTYDSSSLYEDGDADFGILY